MTSPNQTDPRLIELDQLVARIDRHRKTLGLSNAKFATRFQRHLKSADSWERTLLARDWTRIGGRIEEWLKRCRFFVSEIDGGSSEETYLPIPIVRYIEGMFDRLQGATNDRRVVVVIGKTGAGKTYGMRAVHRANVTESAFVEADRSWRKPLQMYIALARAVGAPEDTLSAGNTLALLITHLKGAPTTLFIDEAHEGGIDLFKTIKTLVNKTPAKFVIGTYPTAWSRLVNANVDAMREAQQLLGRTIKPIAMEWAEGVREKDVTAYITLTTDLGKDAATITSKLMLGAKALGLRYVADVVEAARTMADAEGEDLTGEMIVQMAAKLLPGGAS